MDTSAQAYSKLSNLVLGFHGCSQETYENVLYKHQPLLPSDKDYDWLGPGIYFWEQNLERAWQWAHDHHRNPAVIGAVIDLGQCLNLMDSHHIQLLKEQYEFLKLDFLFSGAVMPENKNINGDADFLLRKLDCAVIKRLHDTLKQENLLPYDSVRGLFLEGKPIYPNAGFREKTHIQISVINPSCIKGYFSPIKPDTHYSMP